MGASGNTTVNFGSIGVGSTAATVDVTGQTGFTVSSQVEAWLQPVATADHTIDEHRVEEIEVFGAWQVDGTIRIYAEWEPDGGGSNGDRKGNGMPYGLWTVGWVWV